MGEMIEKEVILHSEEEGQLSSNSQKSCGEDSVNDKIKSSKLLNQNSFNLKSQIREYHEYNDY